MAVEVPVWLAAQPAVERLDLGGGSWVDVVRGFVPAGDEVHDGLADAVAWQQGRVFRYERWVDEPRVGSWATPAASPHPSLVEAHRWLQHRYRVTFDGFALARYRDGRDSVAWHRDRELRWLDDTIIAVLTLGATRPWLVRPLDGRRDQADDPRDVRDLRPASGDLLVMGGRCQAAWLHAVPKVPAGCASRISVQWRWASRRGTRDTNPSYFAPRYFSDRRPGAGRPGPGTAGRGPRQRGS